MKTIIHMLIITLLSFFVLSCSEELIQQAQTGSLKGKVVKRGTNTPIANMKISTSPTTKTVFSGADGTFEITEMPVGDYSVKAELTGYVASFQGVNLQNQNQAVSIVFEMNDDTSLNSPPTTPKLLSPIDNAENQPQTVELTWTATDPDKQDSLKYTLLVKNNRNTDVLQIDNIAQNHYTLPNLNFGVSYFWQIAVSDGVHPKVLSETSKFTVSSIPPNRYHYVRKQNGNFYIFSSDEQGKNFQFTSLSANSWRPRKNNNAGLIAFLRTDGGGAHIYTANPDGSNPFRVTSVPLNAFNNYEMDFSWSTNGKELIYSNFDKLYRINKDGSGMELVYTTPDGSLISECDWSYDSSKIALKTNDFNGYNTKIYIIDMLGNTIKTILSGVTGGSGGLNFSVDGQKLLYTHDISGYQDGSYRQLDSRIYIYNLTNDSVEDISDKSRKPAGTNDLDPKFSPDNAQIILTNTSNDNISQRNIIIISLNTSGNNTYDRKILFSNGEMPDYE
ncbi:carboxypeptidase regulatory-like domain-containing protein [Elizabethkingia meningoseptica]|uniref:carboxypeptidase regulatory-like domain-containing protein n=1 Tax=Elizabethkingia meningoseptica TaxID=238 RepID=UPI0023B1EAE8|nr:carboxypeptidase regulatory-like domain-containing protein [Elizabethkingia meningoseptica]MDE5437703.1 carboxypeptidase regulatory-like domain-containing protein [Elizabethkingia meningoseptica]MDE5507264.1 carboxypeptidase regulatory-like domain-containing protein [Elizabethkingia meningoseptica]MDE5515453.1 carboxypeptidase regulatory-like domain-containing protein [Elizabethkingia meningoseptica]MDE5526159.1 carboxypeptidase regulatory-like domain-containing protein [Elizabethkingia meni